MFWGVNSLMNVWDYGKCSNKLLEEVVLCKFLMMGADGISLVFGYDIINTKLCLDRFFNFILFFWRESFDSKIWIELWIQTNYIRIWKYQTFKWIYILSVNSRIKLDIKKQFVLQGTELIFLDWIMWYTLVCILKYGC